MTYMGTRVIKHTLMEMGVHIYSFMVGLPSQSKRDVISAVMDRHTQSMLFTIARDTWRMDKLAHFYVMERVHLHGILKDIV